MISVSLTIYHCYVIAKSTYMFSFTPCQRWPISLFPLVDWSERNTSRWSSELSRTAVGPHVSATLTHLDPNATKCLQTGNRVSSCQVWLLGGRWRTATRSHQGKWADQGWRSSGLEVQQDHTLCLCWKQSVRYISLQDQSCKVSRRDYLCVFVCKIEYLQCSDVSVWKRIILIFVGPQCVPRRIYSITTGGSRSQLFVAMEGTGPCSVTCVLTENIYLHLKKKEKVS